MKVSSDYSELLRELNAAGARYLIVGAYAVIFYAEPRYTKDLDVWVQPTADNAERVYRALARFGAPLATVEVEDFATPGIVYQIGVEPVRVDIITALSELDFAQAFAAAREVDFGDVPVRIIGLKELIRSKRQAGRPQDLLDLASLEEVERRDDEPDA